MNVAVLTLTRDRLAYTQHCFQTLQTNAGCGYDHFIVDNASTDGTDVWLDGEYEADRITAYSVLHENVGICKALNMMLDEEFNAADYDVVVRFDNDCEVTQPDTLKAVCEVACKHQAIIAPHVQGLNSPPPVIGRATLRMDSEPGSNWLCVKQTFADLDAVHHLGGIFMAIPASIFSEHGFRYDETQPLCGGDEMVCPWWNARGGLVGYLDGYSVNHYETTEGQKTRFPEYWDRKLAELSCR